MNNKYLKAIKSALASLFLGFIFITPVQAQFGDIGTFLKAGAEDASKLTKEFLKPYPTGFGTGLNAGFTETATPKKLLGFSLQIRPSLAVVPSSDKSFDINTLGLQKIRVSPGENSISPTIAGSSDKGPMLEIFENNQKISEFRMPGGTGFAYVPAPIVQASVGLIKGTDVTLRFLPEIQLSDYGDISILGGAIKHDIGQYIPGSSVFPMDISVMVGFNKINIDANLDLQPDNNATRDPNDPKLIQNPSPDFSNQQTTTSTNTFVANILVGKSLPFISGYVGLGFQKASFDLDMKGDYPVSSYNPLTPGADYVVLSNPFSLTIDSDSSVHALAGFRIKLGILAFYGEATLANYLTANAGIGISFR